MMVVGSLPRRSAALRAVMLAGCMAAAAALSVGVDAFAQPAAVTSEAPGRKAVQPEDIMGLTDVIDAEISPDGRHVLYVTQPTIATSRPTRSEIWIVASDGKSPARRLTRASLLDGSPQWSPDGRTIAFLSNRADAATPGVPGVEPSQVPAGSDQSDPSSKLRPDSAARPSSSRQLWLISPDGSGERRLTAAERDVSRFRWSPDGRSIAFLAPDGPPAHAQHDRAAQGGGIIADAPRDLSRIWIMDVAARDIRRLAVADRDITDLSWSPDGKRLAVRAAPTTGLNDLFYHSELLILDAKSGAVDRKLFDTVFSTASWSPDGSQVAFTAPGEGTIGIRAFVADVENGAARELGTTLDGTIRQLEWSRDNRKLLARVVVHSRDMLFSADAATGVFRPLVKFGGRIGAFAEAGDGSIAIAGSQPDRAADVWVYRGGKLRRLTELNPQMREWKLGKVEEVSWASSRDGRPIYGVLITPPGYRAGIPVKTVVLAHGGPHETWTAAWQGSWIDWGQMLASHGYAVLLPNPRGSAGQGNDFARAVKDGWGTNDYQDLADGVDMLVTRKISDPLRLGIGGWSYGGFMSAWAVTHDTRFKAAVVGAALTDQVSAAVSTDTPDFITAYFGVPPSGNARMDASSPLRMIDRVNTPVLVLHGQEDRRVPITQGLGFYRGLRLLGKEAMMVSYPREPHRIVEPQHQADIQRRVLTWFDDHL